MNAIPHIVDFKTEPHSIEAEQALLGAVLINNDAFYRVSDFLEPAHFFEPIHQGIYEVCAKLVTAGKRATPVTIKTFLPADLEIAGMSINRYLARLAAEATTIINAEDYGRLIRGHAVRRELIRIGSEIADSARNGAIDESPSRQIEEAERQLYSLSESGRYGSGFISFAVAATEAIDMAARAYQRDGALAGLPTGLIDVDAKMGGLQPSDVVILAGRPGMGKTALATNIAYHLANKWRGETGPSGRLETTEGAIVGFFSLEMSAEQLATRIIAEQSAVPSSAMRRGTITEDQFMTMRDVTMRLQAIPLHIDQDGGLTLPQIVARARRLKRQKGLDLIVIDYLQLMHGNRRHNDNRTTEITEITSGLKALAKELNVPILALSQLSREVEKRDNKRPRLSDLRESGSIEQDADVVLFLYREEYYHDIAKPSESDEPKFGQWLTESEKLAGKAELIIGKQRHGPTGTVELQFDASMTRFSSLAAGG